MDNNEPPDHAAADAANNYLELLLLRERVVRHAIRLKILRALIDDWQANDEDAAA